MLHYVSRSCTTPYKKRLTKTNVRVYNISNLRERRQIHLAKPIKPGTDNQKPGTYIEVGPRGGKVNDPRIVKIDSGDRLPPTQAPGHGWQKK